MQNTKKIGRGFALIELLIVLVIIAFIIFKMLNNYYKRPALDKSTQIIMSEQGIDTANYSSIKDSIKNKLQHINAEHKADLDKIEQ